MKAKELVLPTLALLISMLVYSIAGFAYIQSTYVSKDVMVEIKTRLGSIDTKLTNIENKL